MAAPSGVIAKIHAALATQDMTARQLGVAIDRTARQVSNAIQSAKRVNGPKYVPIYIAGHTRVDGFKQPIYTLNKPERESSSSSKIRPRYVPEFRSLTEADYDIRAHMRQAVAGR